MSTGEVRSIPAETDGVLLEVEQRDGAGSITHSRVSVLMTSSEDGWCVRVPAPPTAQQSNSQAERPGFSVRKARRSWDGDLPVEGA